jgi:tRNA threonylcarbamoyladenosine biosynthesis protein TsaE
LPDAAANSTNKSPDDFLGGQVSVALPAAADTRGLGARLAGLLRAGDLVILSGELGAGKTTLVQGIGQGLGVRGQVASPTFIIARHHPPLGDGPGLLHVDAYRLESLAQLDYLDLDTELENAVTVVEWGAGLAEALAEDRLEVHLDRARGSFGGAAGDRASGDRAAGQVAHGQDAITSGAPEAMRTAWVRGIGKRWEGVELD